jgi:DNA-binding XRE family transcriptional regulator
MWSVYALIDPRDNTIRYIGITTNTAVRLDQHLGDAGKKSEKGKWLTELKQSSLSPMLRVLETINTTGDTRAIARDRERYWIQTFLQSGAHLVNDFGVIRAYPQYGRSQSVQSLERPKRLRTCTVNQQLKQHRLDASLSRAELARRAGVDVGTVTRAEESQPVQKANAAAIAHVISQALGQHLGVQELGIVIYS